MPVPLWLELWGALLAGAALCSLIWLMACRFVKERPYESDLARPSALDPLRAADRARQQPTDPIRTQTALPPLRLEQPRLRAASCDFCWGDHPTAQCPHILNMKGAA